MKIFVLKLTGVFCIVGALFGLVCSVISYRWIASPQFTPPEDVLHFYPAFFFMLSISATILISMLWSGIQLYLQKISVLQLFVATCILMVLLNLAAVSLWLKPSIGVAAIFSSIGLSIFDAILFPLWAPFWVSWAFRKTHSSFDLTAPQPEQG